MHERAIEAAAKALQREIFIDTADKGEANWASNSQVRDARRREARATIAAYLEWHAANGSDPSQ